MMLKKLPLFSLFIAFSVSLISPISAASAPDKKPNVVFLFADDMRWDMVRSLGDNKQIHTPNLDKLAEDGVAFRQAYNMGGIQGAVCVASRAMVLSGLSLHKLGNNGRQLLEKNVTMGTHFGEAGYKTYHVGKWHNGIPGLQRSFQNGAEILLGGMTDDQFNVPLNHFQPDGNYKRSVEEGTENSQNLPEYSDHIYKGKHSSEIFADAAIKFLNDNKEASSPYFLYVAFTAPHDPRQAPESIKKLYKDTSITLPLNFMPEHPFNNGHNKGRDETLLPFPRDPEKVKEEIRDYYTIITHMDQEIGRVIETLKKTGQYDNTIVIFAADNGLAVGSHGLLGKQSLYEHSIHIPLIWKSAGESRKAYTNARVYLSDIFNTLCDELGISAPKSTDGKSFVKVVKGESDSHRDLMYFSFRQFQRSVADTKYKLIEYNVEGTRTTQLFDMENDRDELKNLADDPAHKETVEKYRKLLLEEKEKYADKGEFWTGF